MKVFGEDLDRFSTHLLVTGGLDFSLFNRHNYIHSYFYILRYIHTVLYKSEYMFM